MLRGAPPTLPLTWLSTMARMLLWPRPVFGPRHMNRFGKPGVRIPANGEHQRRRMYEVTVLPTLHVGDLP